MTLFVYICSTFSVVERKTRFETGIAKNEINGAHSFHLQLICAKYTTCNLYVKQIYTIYSILAIHVSNAFFVQLHWMSINHIGISSFGERQFSSPHLKQKSLHRPIKHKILDMDIWCPLWSQVSLMTSAKTFIK
jgi:hypothetical protein